MNDGFISGIRRLLLKRRVNKIWRNSKIPALESGALKEFDDLKKQLSQDDQKIAQDCWDKLEESYHKG